MLSLLDGDGSSSPFASSIKDSCSSLFRGVSSSGFISDNASSLRMHWRSWGAFDEGGRRVASMHFTDVPLEGVDTGTLSFSVSFELKWVIGLLPGTPVHASAAQALRRPPPADATCMELARDRLLLLLGHQLFLWIAILWLISLLSWGIFVGLWFIALYMPMIIVAIRGIARTAEENEADSSDDWYMIGLSDDQLRMWSNICIQVRQHLLSHPHQHQHQH